MSRYKIIKAEDFDLSVDEEGRALYRVHRLTEFGRKHGGADMALQLVVLTKLALFVGIFILAVSLGNTDLGIDVKSYILASFAGLVALVVFTIIFMWWKTRYALAFVGVLLGCLAFLVGILILIGWALETTVV